MTRPRDTGTRALRSLDADRRGSHGQWPEPGVWTPDVTPVMCGSGWHACPDTAGLLDWLGETVWLVELGGVIVGPEGGKIAAQRARLVRRLPYDPRGWAADCAERVLPIYEAAYPEDSRPRDAIAAARSGDAAAWAAARAAAWDAARAAARDAARDAAWDAARDAARAAAWAAAWDAARDAAGAAWEAREAAWAAAGAAWEAGEAAWAAAGAAWEAGEAAWAAERAWQAQHLAEMLGVPTDLTGWTP